MTGELTQELTFRTSIEKGEKLLYSSKPNEFYIKKMESSGKEVNLFNLNVISPEDFMSKDIRFVAPRTGFAKIETNAEEASITMYTYYKVV